LQVSDYWLLVAISIYVFVMFSRLQQAEAVLYTNRREVDGGLCDLDAISVDHLDPCIYTHIYTTLG